MTEHAQPRSLQVVARPPRPSSPTPPEAPAVVFCARCGAPPQANRLAARSRVCALCGLGLVLQAPAGLGPSRHDAFAVVNRSLRVCALSEGAESLLDVTERDAVGGPITALVVPIETNGQDDLGLLALLRAAAIGVPAVRHTHGRVDGSPLPLRVGPCGPPRAALLVIGAGASR